MTIAASTLEPGGRGQDPALTVAGRTISYAAFAERVARATVAAGSEPIDLAGLGTVDLLTALFAGAAAGVPVVVRDPAHPVPDLGTPPPSTFLVAVTSGSTGRPRLICRTAASWVASFEPFARAAGLTAADTVAMTGPLHATLHLFAAVHTLAIGAHLTDRVAEATAVHAVPAALAGLLDTLPPGAPLRTAVVAGSALPGPLAERAGKRGIAVIEYYGAAELSFVAIRRAPQAFRPFPGVLLRIDADGVLWAASPYLASGYLAPPAPAAPRLAPPAAASRSTGALRSVGGFATVGDRAAWIDDNPAAGLLIRGRGDAAITTAGHTVLAEDVEAALAGIPGVVAAAVVGLPHPRFGQVVTAALQVPRNVDRAELRAAVLAAVRASLSGAARPRRYLLVDALPRTAGGKIARGALAAALTDGTLPTRPLA